jgi:hypothetical protein
MAVGRGCYSSQWDALGVYDHRTLDATFSSVHGAFARLLATAGSLRDAAIYGHIGEVEANHPVIGVEHNLLQAPHHSGGDPLVASTTQGSS